VQSKADMSQLNLPHGTENYKWKTEKLKSKKTEMLRSIGKQSAGNPWSRPRKRKERLRWKGFAEKEGLRLEWKSEGLMGQVRGADCDFRGADVWGHIFGAGVQMSQNHGGHICWSAVACYSLIEHVAVISTQAATATHTHTHTRARDLHLQPLVSNKIPGSAYVLDTSETG